MLNRRPHSNELTTECTGFHGILPFTVPDNRSPVQEYEDPGLRPPRYSVRRMIRVDKTVSRDCMPSWGRHVHWHLLLSVTIEVIPFVCA